MKKLLTSLLAVAFLAVTVSLQAQDEKPAASPFSKVEQKVGTTDVTIEYSRPGKKGREIYGSLVPYDKIWRTGANAATKISFSKDVKVEGKDLAAGTYALLTTPGKSSWDVHFFTFEGAGANSYNGKEPALTVTVTPAMMSETVETFLIIIDELRDTSGTLMLLWDNVAVPVALGVM